MILLYWISIFDIPKQLISLIWVLTREWVQEHGHAYYECRFSVFVEIFFSFWLLLSLHGILVTCISPLMFVYMYVCQYTSLSVHLSMFHCLLLSTSLFSPFNSILSTVWKAGCLAGSFQHLYQPRHHLKLMCTYWNSQLESPNFVHWLTIS